MGAALLELNTLFQVHLALVDDDGPVQPTILDAAQEFANLMAIDEATTTMRRSVIAARREAATKFREATNAALALTPIAVETVQP